MILLNDRKLFIIPVLSDRFSERISRSCGKKKRQNRATKFTAVNIMLQIAIW